MDEFYKPINEAKEKALRQELMIEGLDEFGLTPDENPFELGKQEEKDYWTGKGELTFTVLSNRFDVFEIEILSRSGCLGGMEEGCGIEYYLENCWDIPSEVWEGVTYTISGVTSCWTRGDGWTYDDDVEYDFEEIKAHFRPLQFIGITMKNLWWFNIGWRIRDYRNERKLRSILKPKKD